MSDDKSVEAEKPIKILPSKIIRKSSMRQTLSGVALIAGIAWFAYQLGELFQTHGAEGWAYFHTPVGVGDILKTAGSAGIAICGALGLNVRDLFAKKEKE